MTTLYWQQTQSCEPHVSTVLYCSSLLTTSSTFCRGSGTATTLSEVSLDLTSGTLTMTDYTSFLNSSVLVTGAVLASTGDCVLGDTIAFNISTQENDSEGENVDTQGISYNSLIPLIVNFTEVMDKLFNDSGVTNTLIDQLLQLPTPSSSTLLDPTDIPSPDDILASHTVALIVVVVFLSVLVILILVIVGILFSRKRR